jgi:hypothetical protein
VVALPRLETVSGPCDARTQHQTNSSIRSDINHATRVFRTSIAI